MWIGDIDIPQAVLDAAEAGELVFFVGAGASRAQPSSLPDFEELVRDIGARAGRNPVEDEVRQPDVFLGRLSDLGVNVHQLVAMAIGQPESLPNSLHAAIATLAVACRTPRIVTTNYDRHIESAAEARSLDLQIYEAPALPVGDDFEGLVHLHGSLCQSSQRLVVTDSDFGRAYLREAWAARFLERMFSTFTVLFIGYSHGDVVMQYLARSLGSNRSRYVLTSDAHNAEWRRLGLTPIPYPNDSGDHAALPTSLERWRDLATMGHVEHRSRLGALVSGEPPTIPEEASYVEAALAHPERIRYFAEKAKFEDVALRDRWFAWLEGRPRFAALFSPEQASEVTSRVLMAWIAEEYILRDGNSAIALRAFSERAWPSDTWFSIAQILSAYTGAFPEYLCPWLLLVLQKAPSRQHELLDILLVDKEWSTNFDLALTVFEDRTRPYLKRRFDFGAPSDMPSFEVDLCGGEYWLTENWTEVFVPMLDEHLEQLLRMVSEQIARVYRSLRSLSEDNAFDPLTFSRSAIESHEQDHHREAIDVLIDAARDCIEAALLNDLALARQYLAAWSTSPDAIIRRLAVHGWRVRSDLGPEEKLTWLREHKLLWVLELQHEVFQLIRESFPSADDDARRLLVAEAVAGPDGEQDEHSRYRSFNLLGWLSSSAPDCTLARDAFAKAHAENPGYGRREHPDLNRYSSFGVVEDALPFTEAQLHELIMKDPAEAIARLWAFSTGSRLLTGPTWTGALRSLQACVTTYPADGLRLAGALRPDDREFRASLIYGWGGAALSEAMAEDVLLAISEWDRDEVRRPACDMLANGGDLNHPTPWHQNERARHLAEDLWPTGDVEGTIEGGSDLVIEAINHPAGDLAQFWTKVIQWEWSENEATWNGIPAPIAEPLERLTSATDRNGLLARTFLSSQLHFYFGADREWCENRLLPLLDWNDEVEAMAAWQGFLTWGRWSDGLLQAGLLDGYLATAIHADKLPEALRSQLARALASIAMFGPVAPTTWLTRFIVNASEELRVDWTQKVGLELKRLGPSEVAFHWSRWIFQYWTDRNQSVPVPFTSAEASATANWVVELAEVRSQAIDCVLGSHARLDERGGFLYRLRGMDLAAEANDWVRVLTHLLKNTSGQQWFIGRQLKKVVALLRAGVNPPDLTDLINEAMRLGVTDVADW